ncbi:hypothetical protein HUW62_36310 [Myxococcus sp. AM011]|nr:hypothetical protein [Myxococcus sp. AM011]
MRERSRVGSAEDGSRVGPASDGSRVGRAADGSRVGPSSDGSRVGPASDGSRVGRAADGSRVGPASGGSRVGRAADASRVGPSGDASRVGPAGESSRVQRPPEELSRSSRVRPRADVAPSREDPEGSRVFRSRSSVSVKALRPDPAREGGGQQERPPRVLAGRAGPPAGAPSSGGQKEGTAVQRRPRSTSDTDKPVPPGSGGRGPRGGTR